VFLAKNILKELHSVALSRDLLYITIGEAHFRVGFKFESLTLQQIRTHSLSEEFSLLEVILTQYYCFTLMDYPFFYFTFSSYLTWLLISISKQYQFILSSIEAALIQSVL